MIRPTGAPPLVAPVAAPIAGAADELEPAESGDAEACASGWSALLEADAVEVPVVEVVAVT